MTARRSNATPIGQQVQLFPSLLCVSCSATRGFEMWSASVLPDLLRLPCQSRAWHEQRNKKEKKERQFASNKESKQNGHEMVSWVIGLTPCHPHFRSRFSLASYWGPNAAEAPRGSLLPRSRCGSWRTTPHPPALETRKTWENIWKPCLLMENHRANHQNTIYTIFQYSKPSSAAMFHRYEPRVYDHHLSLPCHLRNPPDAETDLCPPTSRSLRVSHCGVFWLYIPLYFQQVAGLCCFLYPMFVYTYSNWTTHRRFTEVSQLYSAIGNIAIFATEHSHVDTYLHLSDPDCSNPQQDAIYSYNLNRHFTFSESFWAVLYHNSRKSIQNWFSKNNNLPVFPD